MNQSQNIFNCRSLSFRTVWPQFARRTRSWILVALVFAASWANTRMSHAQEPFSSQFQPPVQARIENNPQFESPSTSDSSSFPVLPIPFDPRVGAEDASTVQKASFVSEVDGQVASTGSDSFDIASAWNNFTKMAGAKWQESGASESMKSVFGDVDIARVLGSLALVLGGYFGLVGVLRFFSGEGSGGVPTEVLELLGTVPLAHNKQLQIVRLGSKLLLVVDGENGTHPIGEISDPDEVEYLASLCPGRKKVGRSSVARVASATRGMAQRESARQSAAAVAPTTPVPSPTPSPAPQAAPSQDLATSASHLAAILQSLNGPKSGHAAVFEA